MTEGVDPPASPPADGGAAASWALLIGISAIAAAVLTWLAIPAALLLGSMLAGMVVAFRGASLKVPPQAFAISQGLLGCMIAKIRRACSRSLWSAIGRSSPSACWR